MFQEKGHWIPGTFPTKENLKKIDLSAVPKGFPLVELIQETHHALYKIKE